MEGSRLTSESGLWQARRFAPLRPSNPDQFLSLERPALAPGHSGAPPGSKRPSPPPSIPHLSICLTMATHPSCSCPPSLYPPATCLPSLHLSICLRMLTVSLGQAAGWAQGPELPAPSCPVVPGWAVASKPHKASSPVQSSSLCGLGSQRPVQLTIKHCPCPEYPGLSAGPVPTRSQGTAQGHNLCPLVWPGPATQVCCVVEAPPWTPCQQPGRSRLPCEAPAPGRPRCPVGSGRPPAASSQRCLALPGTSCSSQGGGAGPCPAPASPLNGGCLHSAPGEGEEGQVWVGATSNSEPMLLTPGP